MRITGPVLASLAILAAAIVLAVLINLLVGAIPKKYTEFDLSAAKMYTLGDSSRQLMQSLDQILSVLKGEMPYFRSRYQIESLRVFGSYARGEQNKEMI